MNQSLLQIKKDGNCVLRNMNDWETSSYSFLLRFLSCISQSFALKYNIERKGKIGQPIEPLPFNPSLFISKLEVQCVDKMCKYQGVKVKAAELALCTISLFWQEWNTYACTNYEIQMMLF